MDNRRELELTPGKFYTIGNRPVTFIRIEKEVARVIPHTGGPLKHGEPVIIDLVPPKMLRPMTTLTPHQ